MKIAALNIVSTLALGAALVSCGGNARRDLAPTTIPTEPPITTPGTTTVIANLPPPVTQKLEILGYTGGTITVATNKTLKIRVTPGKADKPVEGTNYAAKYAGLGVYISVENYSHPTPLLGTGESGQPQQRSQIYDYSDKFTKTCPANRPDCKQNVTVTIEKPNYDYWCFMFQQCSPNYYTHVHETHWVNVTVEIETDFTRALQ